MALPQAMSRSKRVHDLRLHYDRADKLKSGMLSVDAKPSGFSNALSMYIPCDVSK